MDLCTGGSELERLCLCPCDLNAPMQWIRVYEREMRMIFDAACPYNSVELDLVVAVIDCSGDYFMDSALLKAPLDSLVPSGEEKN